MTLGTKKVQLASVNSNDNWLFYLFLCFLVGFPLRFVFAILRSSVLLIDLYMLREAPLSDDLDRLPRFAESAAPAAICCFFDFAGIHQQFRA